MRRSVGRFAALALMVAICSGVTASAAAVLDSAARTGAVETLLTALRERYVFVDVGDRAADAIEKNMRGGAYDALSDPVKLAARLDADITALTHDKHARVLAEGSPDPGSTPPPHNEGGIVRADRLRGGLGYIEVSSFPPLAVFRPVIDRAMRALDGSAAIIFDLRRNSGGDTASVAYLVSFLTRPSEPIHINDIVARQAGTETFARQVFNSQATPVSYAGRPAFVLTSGATFSGGEEFAYDVQNLKLATVVGEITGGGANPTGAVPLGPGLSALIPWGRAENPVTRSNWEGAGVRPDVRAAADDAFKIALERLGQRGTTDVASASTKQVFVPRSTPLPGSEAALRRLIEGLISGAPDYSAMTPAGAASTRQVLPRLHEQLSALAPVTGVKFREIDALGGDVYDATFLGGARRFAVLLTGDSKIEAWAFLGPPPASPPS